MAARHSTTPRLIPAVGYLRRSTTKQEKSLPEQRAEIEAYAAEHGYTIVRWYIDDGISGDATEKRLDFQRMHKAACNGRDFEVILCWDQDRFGRFDSMEGGYWIHPLRKAGVRLETVTEGPIDWTDFAGRVMFGIKQEGKHQFLHDLAKRVARGQKDTAKNGGWPGGTIPYGFDRGEFDAAGNLARRLRDGEKKRTGGYMVKPVPSEDTAKLAAVRFAFDRFAHSDVSIRGLAAELDAKGHPSPTGIGWRHSSLAKILGSPVYIGTLRWGDRPMGKYAAIAEPIERTAAWEPIIDRDTFDRVQKKLGKGGRKRSARRAEFPLRGLIYCAGCGRPMIGSNVRQGKYRYHRYICADYDHRRGQSDCGRNIVDADRVIGWLVPALQRILTGPGRPAMLQGVAADLRARAESAAEAPQRLDTRLADLDAQIDRLRRAIAQVDDSGLVEQLREAKRQREAVAGELAQAGKFTTPADVDGEADRIVNQVFQVAEALAEAEPATLRELLAQVVYRIECEFSTTATKTGRKWTKLVEGRVELRESALFAGLWGGVNHG